MPHFEISEALVDEVTEEVYVFWRNLLHMTEVVGCPHATYTFIRRDLTLDRAYRTITGSRGWDRMAPSQYDKIKKVIVERVEARFRVKPVLESVVAQTPEPLIDRILGAEERAKLCIRLAQIEGYQGKESVEGRAVQLMDLDREILLARISIWEKTP